MFTTQIRPLYHALRVAGILAALACTSVQLAFASLVIDLRFADGTTTASLNGRAANETVTIQVWATITGTDAIHTNDGLVFTYFGVVSASPDTTHLTGNLTNASANLAPFNDVTSQQPGTFADRNADTIGDWRGTTTNNISNAGWPKASFGLASAQLGGGAVGQEAGASGWAFHIADAIFQIGSISSAGLSGVTPVLSFNPAIPTPLSPANRASWQEDGTSPNRTGTSGPTLGTGVTFTLGTGDVLIPDIDPTPTSLQFNLLLNAAVPTQNVTLNNVGSGPGTYSTSTSGVASVASGGSGTILAGGNTAMGVTVTGGTAAFQASTPGSVTITTPSDPDGNADVVNVTKIVGEASTTGTTFAGAVVLSANVGGGGSYANLASRTTSSGPAPNPGNVGTTATILGGTNSSGPAETVSMQWRQRTVFERGPADGGTPTSPPLQSSTRGDPAILISDVVSLTGLVAADTSQNTPGRTRTDVYVLQMTYDVNRLIGGPLTEGDKINNHSIFLAWLDPNGAGLGIPQWQNAVNGNFTKDPAALFDAAGSWLANGSPLTVGSWGVDAAAHTVWAVLDHASEFAVVPEPASIVLFGLGAIGLTVGLRRRRHC